MSRLCRFCEAVPTLNQAIPKWAKELVMEEVNFIGVVTFIPHLFTRTTGEITFISSVLIDEERYRSLPFLRLTIQKWDPDAPVEVDDDYSSLIPYLKRVPGFRKYFPSLIKHAMLIPAISGCDLFEEGLQIYGKELSTYSDVQGLVSQAKVAVKRLDARHSDAERQARAILSAMYVTPLADIKFIS